MGARGTRLTERTAVSLIEQHGVLLVYPIANRPEPQSLWGEAYPGVRMRWEWDTAGDDRVVRLWHLRAQLAASRTVVYSKWHGGRATFFSRALFTAMLATLRAAGDPMRGLPRESREILEVLELDSPMSSRKLREAVQLQGRLLETTWTRAMRELWTRLLVVGFGEVDDGAFPSLAVGSTRTLFEDLWLEAETMDVNERAALIAKFLPRRAAFGREWEKSLKRVASAR